MLGIQIVFLYISHLNTKNTKTIYFRFDTPETLFNPMSRLTGNAVGICGAAAELAGGAGAGVLAGTGFRPLPAPPVGVLGVPGLRWRFKADTPGVPGNRTNLF